MSKDGGIRAMTRLWRLLLAFTTIWVGAPCVAVSRDSAAVAIGARVADWQLSHMSDLSYIPADAHRHDAESARDWVQAAFYIGLTQFADVSGDSRYRKAVLAHGAAEAWGFDNRPRHADADATAAVWIW